MKVAKPLVFSFSLLAFSLAQAQAQDPQQPQPQPQPQQQQQQQPQQQQQQGQMSTSQLIGKKVTDSQGEELGEIKDVVIDLQGAQVHAAVLEFGGKLGVGAEQYAFPVSELKPGKGQDQLTLNVEKQKLENGQGFAKGQWPEIDAEILGREGAQAGREGAQASGGASKAQGKTLVLASELEGKEVQDKSGEDVGQIKDVRIDLTSGQVREIVLGVKDAGQTTIEPKALSKGAGDKLVLNMEAKELKSQAQQSSKQGQSQQPQGQGGASAGQSQQSK